MKAVNESFGVKQPVVSTDEDELAVIASEHVWKVHKSTWNLLVKTNSFSMEDSYPAELVAWNLKW